MARKKRRRAHGMGSVYQRGPDNWWIKWREGGRIRYSRGYETRERAEEVRAKIVADLAAGRAGLAPNPRGLPTLQELVVPWLETRQLTHRAANNDRCRWNKHLRVVFGPMRPPEVGEEPIRQFVLAKLATGLNAATVGHCVRLLSTFLSDLVPRYLSENPVGKLSKKTRRLYRPTSDPTMTPFLESLDDVKRVYQALPTSTSVAFAIGAFAGLRTGEILGLEWRDIDLAVRRITVRQQVQHGRLTPLKDEEPRRVTVQASLLPVLAEWKLATGGEGFLFRPTHATRGGRPELNRPTTYVRPHTLRLHLKRALQACNLPPISWYEATRHTFASHWILQGGQKEKLAEQMGHSNTVVTDRYAHLRPDLYREQDYRVLAVDLGAVSGRVVPLHRPAETGTDGYAVATPANDTEDCATVTR